MKIIQIIAGICVAFSLETSRAQTPFQNLNFESATVSSSGGTLSVPVNSALPGWEAFIGTTQQTDVAQNVSAVNAASIEIYGPNNPGPAFYPDGAPGIIDGKFTVALQGGVVINNGQPSVESASIEQTGTIPAGDESLQFKAWVESTTPPFGWTVSFAGNTLPLVALVTTSQYTLYGADISSFAGQTGALEFTADSLGGPSFLELDDINFSTSSVPEPSPAILIGLGGLIFALRQKLPRRQPDSFSTKT